jgi:hypothetical protein
MDSYIPVIVGADHPARFIEGTSINDAGQVVGIHAASSTADHTAGFRFDPGSGLHELGNISASEKGLAPLSINSAGDIVGMAGDYDDPFLYKASASGPKSVRHFFKDAGFKQSFVVEINDAGQILGGGFSKEANRYRSLVLTKDHEIIQFIPGFDDYSTWPTAINNGGLVIGEKQEHGFYAGYAYDLGSKESHLFLPKSYDRDVKVLALNDQGEVLFLDRSAGVFLYKNGVTTELFPMGSGADHPVALDVHQHILSDTATLYDRDNPSDGWVDLNDVTVNWRQAGTSSAASRSTTSVRSSARRSWTSVPTNR